MPPKMSLYCACQWARGDDVVRSLGRGRPGVMGFTVDRKRTETKAWAGLMYCTGHGVGLIAFDLMARYELSSSSLFDLDPQRRENHPYIHSLAFLNSQSYFPPRHVAYSTHRVIPLGAFSSSAPKALCLTHTVSSMARFLHQEPVNDLSQRCHPSSIHTTRGQPN